MKLKLTKETPYQTMRIDDNTYVSWWLVCIAQLNMSDQVSKRVFSDS